MSQRITTNTLFYGDNRDILREYLASIDTISAYPPSLHCDPTFLYRGVEFVSWR